MGKALGELFTDLFETTVFVASVSQKYYKANNRWPKDFEELAIFWEKMDSEARNKICEQRIGRGFLEDMDMDMIENINFSPQDDGSLKAEIIRTFPIADSDIKNGTITLNSTITIPIPSDDLRGEKTGRKAGSSTKTKSESLNTVKGNSSK
jgi:hypothetical protein